MGTAALVNEDDGQKEGGVDRPIVPAYSEDDVSKLKTKTKKSLKELLFARDYAVIYQDFAESANFLRLIGRKDVTTPLSILNEIQRLDD